jgi:hypothetical protein
VTVVAGIHIAELREAVDAVRASAGLQRLWTPADYTSTSGNVTATQFYEATPTSPPRDLFTAIRLATPSPIR